MENILEIKDLHVKAGEKEILKGIDLVVKNDDKLSGKGVMNLSSIQIITPSFEPALIYDIYKDTIDSIKNMKVDFGYSWNEDDGLSLDLQTDAAEVFQAAFTASFTTVWSSPSPLSSNV